ncbi:MULTISPECIES: metal-dependent transcriptional regulator [Halococcus]|uniref:Iron (Metal) dependent repressor, DtxR family protein n=1 Tax=Halococcus salifodinae DSM 8989 TaxID=1227456 RepID=M0NEL8_9EURY|nr:MULTISPECIES: metal-dependent transcriptional regulator [Halococcus]EMA55509.1 iron (metal) dependent repressor, DtxR family protein [Halococcus salifodinae DSM 8989]
MPSAKAEDYIKAVYQLQDGDDPVATSAVADALGVTAPTVTATMKRLQEQGLVEREEYKGVRLTPEGELVALETIRHHRLLELFLTEHLGYDWTEVHDEADQLEHHISERLETELAAVLEDPSADPHGAPIPTEDLEPTDADDDPLSEYDEGETVVVTQVADSDSAVLAYLADAGITPGTRLEITEIAPFGMLTVASDDADDTVSLPTEIATAIRVRDTDSEPSDSEMTLAG